MPLHDFSMELALNYSLIIALRMHRLEKHDALIREIDIDKWRHRLLTEEFIGMIQASQFIEPNYHDFGSDFALIFEEIKYHNLKQDIIDFSIHSQHGSHIQHLATLHPSNDGMINFASPVPDNSSINSKSVIFINTVLGQRPGHSEPPVMQALQFNSIQGYICALRANTSETDVQRTTVYGNDFTVPSVHKLKKQMSSLGMPWRWRWLGAHDQEFYLPEVGTAETGILLAYASLFAKTLPEFECITD